MPFKVRCCLIAFMGDEENFPCHFRYKIGDEFSYDGEKFVGRVCPGVLSSMVPVVLAIHRAGNKYCERILFRYAGLDANDPGMKKYDGLGFRPLKEPPKGADRKYIEALSAELPAEKQGGWTFVCGDTRTAALFMAEPVDLADGGDSLMFYKRQMSVLGKIKNEPGISPDEILERFSKWEREEISPPLYPLMLELMLDELAEVNYIDLRDGKAYPKIPSK